jgi:ribose-phosphate pyrophosphokinase
MYDDMIDTGGSIISAASALKNRGVSKIYACATFGIFSPDKDGSAEEKFKKSGIRVVTTNAIPRSDAYYAKHRSWLTCVPIEDLLASAIYANSRMEGSISDLFK